MTTNSQRLHLAKKLRSGVLIGAVLIITAAVGWFAVSAFIESKDKRGRMSLSFDGSSRLAQNVATIAQSYTIDLILRSRTLASNPETMPATATAAKVFVGGGFALLRTPKNYRFFIAGNGFVASAGNPDQWQRISLVVDFKGNAKIYLNGKRIWFGKGQFGLNNSKIYLGGSVGGKQLWRGDIYRIQIFRGVNFVRNFDPNSDILNDSVMLVYEQSNPVFW